MVTEDYVSFAIAKLLKEKGFPQNTFRCHYIIDGNTHYKTFENRCGFGDSDIIAPTLAMAMKWLRVVHNIDIIAPPQYDGIKWTYSAIIFKLSIPCTEIRLNDNKDKKTESIEAAIKYCLEHLI